MSVWTYFCLPETAGYALEDIRYLFEKDVVLRALEDAPGGRLFIGKRRAVPVDVLRNDELEAALRRPSSPTAPSTPSSEVNI